MRRKQETLGPRSARACTHLRICSSHSLGRGDTVTAISPERPNVPAHVGTGSSPPGVFAGRKEIPQSLREGIQEQCGVCWQHSLPSSIVCTKPPASRSGTKMSPNAALRPPQYWVQSPSSATAPHSPAAKPQLLSHSWHSIPGVKGHRTGYCRHLRQGWLWRQGWRASTQQAKWLWMGAGDT